MNKLSLFCIAMAMSCCFACKKSGTDGGTSIINTIKDSTASLVTMKEADYRPLYHFTPSLHWMNDPNGLVYYKGTYHLFYQYNPNASVWGTMNWGHATSTDLFNWKDQPVALAPDNSGTIFSGSAVADAANTAGFKTGTEDPLIAVYTLNGSQQQQSIAYSNDGGTSWTKYANNPVLPNAGVPDFRDPKVFWYAAGQKWIMILAVGNKVQIYSSVNLKSWSLLSEFGANLGAHGGVWECPDLFQLPVDGTATTKWVMLVSVNPGGPNGGSATQYFTGNFDGTTFTSDSNTVNWMDYGTDNYATVTYNNIPAADGRRLAIGWMSNWNYAQQVPTTTWRSTMTVPRALSLVSTTAGAVLRSQPVLELSNYKNSTPDTTAQGANTAIKMLNSKLIGSGSYEIDFTADLNSTNTLTLSIGNIVEKIALTYNKASGLLSVDRSKSGHIDFNTQFQQQITCPYIPKTGLPTDFQVLVDKTSIEIFVDHGEKVITTIYFPNYQYTDLKLQGDGNASVISNFKVKGINKSLR
ncbi:levanase [Mucilaginibacter gracilis]|uniref:Levanase n=1 Tax=Mucilaginibacter gracilis TaxID=423350 RepID=A0A495ITZ3_9SPHI|nr:glycoside hydrolase family 32 protein [Mucilaginibacter gracilis]RKR80140.1 levanase [Mucilaginibacter gracilis]